MTKLACVLSLASLLCFGLSAQEGKKEPADPSKPDPAMHMPDPKTAEHATLALFAGEWDFSLTMHMGPEPMTVTGTSSEKLLFDGLYLMTTVYSESEAGAFEGRGLTGYDRHAKRFVSAWADTESPSLSTSKGTWDPATKTMTLEGEFIGPMGPMATRAVCVIKDADSRAEKVYAKGPDGKETLMMEFTYKRRTTPAPVKSAKVDASALPPDVSKMAGKWTAEMTERKEDGKGMSAKGTETCTAICGGKWMWTELATEMDGGKFFAYQLLGYNPATKTYKAAWVDSAGGNLDIAEGTSDGKVRKMAGKTYDMAGKPLAWDETSTWKDDDHRSLTWAMQGTEAQPAMTLDMTYVRQK